MRYRGAWLVLGLFSALSAVGCSDDAGGSGAGAGNASSSSTGTASGGNGQGGSTGTFQSGDVVSITIQPEMATLVVNDGVVPAPASFQAFGVTGDGSMVPIDVDWSFNRPDIATAAQDGSVTATGLLGGVGQIRATYQSLTDTSDVTVKLAYTYDPENVPSNVKDAFDNPTGGADGALSLLYPYDQTVFPRGLAGPVVQWNGGGVADLYRIRAVSPTFELTAWQTVPPPSRFSFPTVPTDIWRKLTDSTTGAIQLEVQRHDGAQAYAAKTQTWTIAPGSLAGTIYYWEVNQGNVVRLKPGDTAPEAFLQKPAGVTCVACHTVSKDGSTIVASFQGGYSPWGTFDAATGAPIFSSGLASGFQAISPDGQYVLWRHWNDAAFNTTGYLSLSTNNSSGELAQLHPGGGAPSHQVWSTDGNKIAFAVRTDGNGLDFTQSTLWVADVSLNPPGFSNIAKIVDNDAARPTVTFPSYSPDSAWIAFQRATQARTRGAAGEVWLTNGDGTVQIALDRLNGTGSLVGEQANMTYEPTFSPVAVGGYFWVVVVSERQYGNTLTDTNVNTRRKQLWVSAIDANPQAGQDPSHPPFWLPGQELDNQNMRGNWALSPCKQIGNECTAGYECCDGFCVQDPSDGTYRCSETAECAQTNDACQTAADCCDYPLAQCIGGTCQQSVPQ